MNSTSALSNLRVLVTRPEHQAHKLSAALIDKGAEVVELPLIRIVPPSSWKEFDQCFAKLEQYNWIIFASVNAVEFTLQRLQETDQQVSFNNIKIAAIGPATQRALAEVGLIVHYRPGKFVAEHFVSSFPGYSTRLDGTRMLWPKANIGRTLIKDELEQAGAAVDTVCCYSTRGPEHPSRTAAELRRLITTDQIDVITLTSSETVRSFYKLLAGTSVPLEDLISTVRIAVIGPETARTAMQLLGRVDIQPEEYTIAGLVEAMSHEYGDLSSGQN